MQSSPVTSPADELRKFKDLLDDGIITQEEFSDKKKQLLEL
ncbi:SHOCT domain-containing protein [Listeria grandensis]